MTADLPLPLGNDYEVGITLTAYNSSTKAVAGVTGLTVTGFFAASPEGAAIDATLSVQLVDIGAGDYYGVVQGNDITTHLTALRGQRVWLRITSTNSDLTAAVPHVVTDQRYPS